MVHELRDSGLAIGRRHVARLMRENGMKARQKRRFKRTTDSLHAFPVAPNLLDQDFAATGPNQKWGADISYVWTREGWLYLAPRQPLTAALRDGSSALPMMVIDLFARRVVDWATSDRLHKELAERRRHGILMSMSGKENRYDNAMVETFFKTLKSELVWRTVFQNKADAPAAIGRYIDAFYNTVRRHSALDFKSPLRFKAGRVKPKPLPTFPKQVQTSSSRPSC
jgi:putative transposase